MSGQKNCNQTVNKDLLLFIYGTIETTIKLLTNKIACCSKIESVPRPVPFQMLPYGSREAK